MGSPVRCIRAIVLALGVTACGGEVPEAPLPPGLVEVTSHRDGGPGSFRAAVERANADSSVTVIRFVPVIGRVEVATAVAYTGAQALRIEGQGAVLGGAPACDCDLLVSTGGGDLLLRNLVLEDAPRHGVFVEVPAGANGAIAIDLRRVTIRDNGLHGLVVDDQAGEDGTGADSEAGISLVVRSSAIVGNGFRPGFSDFDGIRIDEGGAGDIEATIEGSRFLDNAGDGLELDERGAGTATVHVDSTAFDDNGEQPQDPDDLEDGLDVDEADAGDIDVTIVRTTANGNHDEGIDLEEEGTGDIRLAASQIEASRNVDEGILVVEDAASEAGGGIEIRLEDVTASGSEKGDGIELGEFGPGNLDARIAGSAIRDNADAGIAVEQGGAGQGVVRLEAVTFAGNGGPEVDANGVEVVRSP